MEIKWDYWTGPMNTVVSSLNRSIGQYTSKNKRVKIGITNSPKRRMNEHVRGGIKWDYMIIKYETSSISFASKLESVLIDYHWDYIENEIGGGGGDYGKEKQYLYVLIKK